MTTEIKEKYDTWDTDELKRERGRFSAMQTNPFTKWESQDDYKLASLKIETIDNELAQRGFSPYENDPEEVDK